MATVTAATRERVAAFLDTDYAHVVGAVALATGDRGRAEDAVQDALVKTLSGDSEPENLRAWITVVAVNYVKQAWRRAGAQERAYVRAIEFADTEVAATTLDGLVVHDAMLNLPERQRTIVVLHYYQGLPIGVIAQTLGVTEGTVKTQLHRGRERLVKILTPAVA